MQISILLYINNTMTMTGTLLVQMHIHLLIRLKATAEDD